MVNAWPAACLVLYLLLAWSNFINVSALEAHTSKLGLPAKLFNVALAPVSIVASLVMTLFSGKFPRDVMLVIRKENETKVWEQALDAATLGVFENPFTNLPAYILATTKAMREEARREAEFREKQVRLGDEYLPEPTDDEIRNLFDAHYHGRKLEGWQAKRYPDNIAGLLGPIEHLETAAFLLKTDLEKLASSEEKN